VAEAERKQLHAEPRKSHQQPKRDDADAGGRTVEPGRKKRAPERLELRRAWARRRRTRDGRVEIDAEILRQVASQPENRGVSQGVQGLKPRPRPGRGLR